MGRHRRGGRALAPPRASLPLPPPQSPEYRPSVPSGLPAYAPAAVAPTFPSHPYAPGPTVAAAGPAPAAEPALAAAPAPAGPRRSRAKVVLGVVAAPAVLGASSVVGATVYRGHVARRDCESGDAALRPAACERACDGGSKDHCVIQADLLLAAGKPADADARLRAGLAKSPEWTRGWIALAKALQAQDKHAEAIVELAAAQEGVARRDPQQAAEIRTLAAASQLAAVRTAPFAS